MNTFSASASSTAGRSMPQAAQPSRSKCASVGGLEGDVAAGVGDRLEGDAFDRRVGHAKADDGADLVLVDAPFDGGDEDHGEAEFGAVVEGRRLGRPQVPAPDLVVGGFLEPVELQ